MPGPKGSKVSPLFFDLHIFHPLRGEFIHFGFTSGRTRRQRRLRRRRSEGESAEMSRKICLFVLRNNKNWVQMQL